ncbi:MAG TPA: ATP cone domain-containing protein [Candidatus Paceibacterota bacterium]
MSFLITKADGTEEPFDPSKLVKSLRRAGAEEEIISRVAAHVERELKPQMRTSDIYRHAFQLLRKEKHGGVAARYSLKRAILELGPSGFPFEAYIAELFRTRGYEAQINQIIRGACVEHEVDVVLVKNGIRTFIEAKFHNVVGFKTDLKVVLYVQSRIRDIDKGKTFPESTRGMVVTNTKFTDVAETYARCEKLELLGWDYPAGHNLHGFIEEAGLYPTTALASISRRDKEALLGEKIVLCKNVPKHADALQRIGIRGPRLARLLEEVGALCGRPMPSE